jgi:hypothetical protein
MDLEGPLLRSQAHTTAPYLYLEESNFNPHNTFAVLSSIIRSS